MAFDADKTMVLLNVYPDMSINLPLLSWLLRHRLLREDQAWTQEHVRWYCQRGIAVAMNSAVANIALNAPPTIEQFLFIENDIRPASGGNTDGVLYAEGDVAAVRYETASDHGAWQAANAMHTGMFRASRAVLEALSPGPWFAEEYSPDGSQLTKCLCMYFADRVTAAGFAVVRAGIAFHKVKE